MPIHRHMAYVNNLLNTTKLHYWRLVQSYDTYDNVHNYVHNYSIRIHSYYIQMSILTDIHVYIYVYMYICIYIIVKWDTILVYIYKFAHTHTIAHTVLVAHIYYHRHSHTCTHTHTLTHPV